MDVQAHWVRNDYLSHGELHKIRRAPTEQEATSLEALQVRMAALQEQMDALDEGDEDEADELEREVAALQVQGKAIEADLSTWPVELMKQAGCVVHVDQNGTPTVKRGLIRPDDRSDMAQAARQAGEGGAHVGMVSLPSPKTRPVHSDKLMRRLTAHRVAAVQAELIARPDVALVAITAQLAQKLFLNHDYRCHQQDTVLAITATDSQSDLRVAADDIETSPAWLRMDAERRAWADKLPQDMDAMFPWLLAQDQATVLQLLTFAVASTVTGIHGLEPVTQRTDPLALALGLDMRRWWVASGPSYLNHVSKGRLLEVVTEAVDINAAAPLAALKKDAAVSGAEQAMAGAGWLPMCLRTGASSKPPGDGGGADHVETSDADAVVELAV